MQLLYIDLFCGAGETSTGVERARIDGCKCAEVIACVNHDANAIVSHAANHPRAIHFTEDIRTLDLGPLKVHAAEKRREYPTAKLVLWASLECTNHSRAKGGMSRDADSRTLADHLFRYIEELRPDYIQIENVVEFMEWGPLVIKEAVGSRGEVFCPLEIKHDRKHKTTTVAPVWIPDPENKGTLYRKWVARVREYGYDFEYRVLNAADYGAYTSRIRYFGQFARTGLPIAWPKRTHAKNPMADLFHNGLKPWRPVREVLDFADRGESVFGRKKPLVDATLERIYAGLIKFVAGGKDAFMVKYNSRSRSGKYIPPSVEAPCPTVAVQGRLGVARVDFLSKHFGGTPAGKNIPVTGPAGAITTVDHHAFVSAYYGNGYNSSVERPAPTLTTKDRLQFVRPFIASSYSGGVPAWCIRPDDTPAMRRLKEFCIDYGIVDVTMRMLRIAEMKRIQGFGTDYVLIGTQEEQKKFLGNAVVTEMSTALCEATAAAISTNNTRTFVKIHTRTPDFCKNKPTTTYTSKNQENKRNRLTYNRPTTTNA